MCQDMDCITCQGPAKKQHANNVFSCDDDECVRAATAIVNGVRERAMAAEIAPHMSVESQTSPNLRTS